MAQDEPNFVRGDLLVPTSDRLTRQRGYRVFGGSTGIPSFLTCVDPESGERRTEIAQLPKPSGVFIRPRRDSPERKGYERLISIIGGALENGPSKLSAVLSNLTTQSGLSEEFVLNCIRVFIAEEAISAKEVGKDFELRLSGSQRGIERQKAYAAAFAHELEAQSDQISRLIGHAATAGSHREELVRALIQNHIPQRYHAATGFISGIPNQLDILIYDRLDYSPLFRAGDLVVVPHDSVRGIIEVKSNLTRAELTDAMGHLDDARPLSAGPPVFAGVFAFRGATSATLVDAIEKFHSSESTGDDFHPIAAFSSMVNAVCVLKKSFISTDFIRTGAGDHAVYVPSILEIGTWSGRHAEAAVFFDYLSRFLRHPFWGERIERGVSPLLSGDLKVNSIQPIYGREWGPYEFDMDVERFEAHVSAFHNWFAGAAWTEVPPDNPHSN